MIIETNVNSPGPVSGGHARHDRPRVGQDHQHFDESRNDAAAWLLSLWSIESRA